MGEDERSARGRALTARTRDRIESHIASQPEPKRSDMRALDRLIRKAMPRCRLWFMDGRDERGKQVTNPNIGYGHQTLEYANGTSREFYQVGFSANKAGISVYILGLKDRKYLAKTYGKTIGKAAVTGYCIRFKSLEDIDAGVLADAIRYGAAATG
jgi:hypothetical protein